MSAPTWDSWRKIALAVPESKLVVTCPYGSHRDQLRQQWVRAGLEGNRLSFVPAVSQQEYFRQYQSIDIALDPFPYGGGTTTCDALWMGVPVVSLRGKTAVGRAGASILNQVNLPKLVANNVEEYVKIAANLAGNLPALAELRRQLRARMRQSPLMDAVGFTRDIEAAFRRMWLQWIQ